MRGVTERHTEKLRAHVSESEANRRVQELAATHGDLIESNLWTGITKIRPGAGIAIVGDPQQCADVMQRYIDLGCDSFCLSGYLHDEEATRFARFVRPILDHSPVLVSLLLLLLMFSTDMMSMHYVPHVSEVF